jgi:hypothetical protein
MERYRGTLARHGKKYRTCGSELIFDYSRKEIKKGKYD